ncbi:hypothetical protein Val02_48130 [Virgisporangium aliadipatigenens]|uniref:Uncharacterized protein n=1 Tax=Virgisporangium aliadipatigenens TaxID=741659 RepID=A0A8J3YP02_9ACTN|nr:hypothetical protein Val02_48130 [Virgisporangium aliadipatigenens]
MAHTKPSKSLRVTSLYFTTVSPSGRFTAEIGRGGADLSGSGGRGWTSYRWTVTIALSSATTRSGGPAGTRRRCVG